MQEQVATELRAALGRIAQWWEQGEFATLDKAEAMVREYVADAEADAGVPMGVRVSQVELQDAWRIEVLMKGEVIASEDLSIYPSGVGVAVPGPKNLEDSVQAICRAMDRLGWMVDRYEFESGMDGATNLVIHAQSLRRKTGKRG